MTETSEMSTQAVIQLSKNADRRLRAGHLWVYSNEIDHRLTPLKDFPPGSAVEVMSAQGKWMGSGYVNPHSLIAVRIVSRQQKFPLSRSLLVHRLNIALSLRKRFYSKPFYRLVFGESDGLPGLLVDRYGEYLVVCLTTAGMDRLADDVVYALKKVLKPEGILFRNDSAVRKSEGLEQYTALAAGNIPEKVRLEEGGCRFETSLYDGQKTGWFFDQAENRQRLRHYVKDADVLDVCSYIGSWSIIAAKSGAKSVTAIDVSGQALDQLENNAHLNNVDEFVETLQGDAFQQMKLLRQQGRKFDVVILDPPAFMKRRKDIKAGLVAYKRLNELAIQLLNIDGILITASCSFHLQKEQLRNIVQQAARHNDRFVQVLEEGQQGRDHPVHPAIPETSYLKAFFCRVLGGF